MLRVCEVQDRLQQKNFFTAFDTRRCSWFRDVHLDTEEDTELIQTYKKISLSGQSGKAGEWSTVSDQFQDCLQWACLTDTFIYFWATRCKPLHQWTRQPKPRDRVSVRT